MKTIKVLFLSLFLIVIGWFLYCLFTLPNLSGLGNKTRVPSISVLDDNNKIISSFSLKGSAASINELVKCIEDQGF